MAANGRVHGANGRLAYRMSWIEVVTHTSRSRPCAKEWSMHVQEEMGHARDVSCSLQPVSPLVSSWLVTLGHVGHHAMRWTPKA